MVHRGILIAGVCVAGMLVLLMVQVRADPAPVDLSTLPPPPPQPVYAEEPPPAPAPRLAQARTAPARGPQVQRPTPNPTPEAPSDHVPPTVEEFGDHALEVKLYSQVPQIILAAAARCYRDEEGQYERMIIDYEIAYENSVATISGVRQVSSEYKNAPQLESCIVTKLNGLTWQDMEAPNLRRPLQLSISIHDLRKRAVPDDFGTGPMPQ